MVSGLWTAMSARHHVSCGVVRSTTAAVKRGSPSGVVRTHTWSAGSVCGTRSHTVTVSPSAGSSVETWRSDPSWWAADRFTVSPSRVPRPRRPLLAAPSLALRRSHRQHRPRQPLTAPAVMPPTMKRWRNWNSSTTGMARMQHADRERSPAQVVAVAGEQAAQPDGGGDVGRGDVLAEHDHRGDEELALRGDERQQEDDRQHRRGERQDDPEERLVVRRPVDLGALVEVPRDRVEEALDQPGVGAERAAEVEEHDRHDGARADRRVRVVELVDHQVDGDERQRRREHLDQQQGEDSRAAGP